MSRLKEITIVPRIGLSPNEVAETLGVSKDTVIRNIHRPEGDSLRMPAFRVNERDYRIFYQDLMDWCKANLVGAEFTIKHR